MKAAVEKRKANKAKGTENPLEDDDFLDSMEE